MTKRDLFALHAMMLFAEQWQSADDGSASKKRMQRVLSSAAKSCYDVAEAMLAESKLRTLDTDEAMEVWVKGGEIVTSADGDVHVVVHEPSD